MAQACNSTRLTPSAGGGGVIGANQKPPRSRLAVVPCLLFDFLATRGGHALEANNESASYIAKRESRSSQHAFRLGVHRQTLDFVDQAFVDPHQPWSPTAHRLKKCCSQFFMRGHKAVTSPRI